MPLSLPAARRLTTAGCWLAVALAAIPVQGQGYPSRSTQPYTRPEPAAEPADDYNRYPQAAPATQPWPEEARERYAPATQRNAVDPSQQLPAAGAGRTLPLRFESAANPSPIAADSAAAAGSHSLDQRAFDKPSPERPAFAGTPASFSQPAEVPAEGPPALLLPPAGQAERGERRATPLPSVATLLGSLGVVLGLFLLLAWVVKLAMPKGSALLPRDAVEMLGRTPLSGRHYVHLIRCGNKILLVSVTQGAAETLTEITDPVEVDRLAGICYQSRPFSASANFRQLLNGFASERPTARRRTRLDDELDLSRLTASDSYALGQGATHG